MSRPADFLLIARNDASRVIESCHSAVRLALELRFEARGLPGEPRRMAFPELLSALADELPPRLASSLSSMSRARDRYKHRHRFIGPGMVARALSAAEELLRRLGHEVG